MSNSRNSDDPTRAAIGRGLGRLPSGLYVLTAGRGAAATGMLASWVQQVGFEPPTVVVALKKGRPIEALVRAEGAFCLAVLDEASKGLLGHFARGFEPGEPAFDGIDVATSSLGVPYPTAAHAHLVCKVRAIADDWSDHAVVCGEVVGGAGAHDRQPMVHVRKNGFSY
ncbi:MAG: flavin reductase [Planctomycetes bacterium]|nr:flavin reductase [Planctomycetota bacterium]